MSDAEPPAREQEYEEREEREIQTWIVVGRFDAADRVEDLAAALARYVVVSRGETGCLNIDLAADPGDTQKLLVIEKWDSLDAARRHLDGPAAAAMATAVRACVTRSPTMELYVGVSAHDLR